MILLYGELFFALVGDHHAPKKPIIVFFFLFKPIIVLLSTKCISRACWYFSSLQPFDKIMTHVLPSYDVAHHLQGMNLHIAAAESDVSLALWFHVMGSITHLGSHNMWIFIKKKAFYHVTLGTEIITVTDVSFLEMAFAIIIQQLTLTHLYLHL